MPQFNPKRVLRQISTLLLRRLFERQGYPLLVPWDRATDTPVDDVFRAMQALPDRAREGIEVLLQDVDDMATEDGIRVLVEEAGHRGLDLADALEGMDSRCDKVVWVCLDHPELWDAAVMFARSDSLASGRSWTRRCGMPLVETGTSDAHIRALETALSGFYRERQGRGHHCKIEHFRRGGGQDYYFVYLSDYADTHINFDDQGAFHRASERRAFEIVFAYCRATGTLEMFAKGGKQVIEPLQDIFSRVILGDDLPPADPNAQPYALDHLMDRGFGFPTDPEDGVIGVSIRYMRLSMVGNRRGRIELTPDPEAGPHVIYDILERDLNRERLTRSVLHVTKVRFQFRFRGNGYGLGRSLTFDVTYPSSCTLKSKRETHRLIGEKYLRRFRIDVS